jgi:hypothetical protein
MSYKNSKRQPRASSAGLPARKGRSTLLACSTDRKREAQGSHHEHERIFLSGDLVRRRGIQRAYGSDRLATHRELAQVSDRWRPYRSLAVGYPFASEHAEAP